MEVTILLGSSSDMPVAEKCTKILKQFSVDYQLRVASAHRSPKFVEQIIKDNFDLSPRGIREMLNLNKPIYEITAAYGHFGRMPEKNGSFSWEKTDKINIFSK